MLFYTYSSLIFGQWPGQQWLIITPPISGILILACSHLGSILARFSGFTVEVYSKNRIKNGWAPRMTMTVGIMIQIPFFCALFYAV